MSTNELVGVWNLVSFHDLDDEGTRLEGPLGPAPRGLLVYTADGHVTVNMMRTTRGSAHGGPTHMGYAGHWRLSGNKVVHRIEVTPKAEWVGTEQLRDMVLDQDALTLYGTAVVDGRPQRRVLHWRRTMGRG
ncbi:lipocalin-like domain-containing protein [Streptomyces sp. NPDC048442]|uniref:lipocalin-like domain-containing protein n=1 Tax=Streptomyces sp. NPDC048442 TaxID=3154823 RepID=UPI00343341C3